MTIPSDYITRESLLALIAARLDISPEEIPGNADLITLGMNSLEVMTVVNRLRRQSIPVTYDTLAAEPTLDSWWHVITKAIETRNDPG